MSATRYYKATASNGAVALRTTKTKRYTWAVLELGTQAQADRSAAKLAARRALITPEIQAAYEVAEAAYEAKGAGPDSSDYPSFNAYWDSPENKAHEAECDRLFGPVAKSPCHRIDILEGRAQCDAGRVGRVIYASFSETRRSAEQRQGFGQELVEVTEITSREYRALKKENA